MVGWSEIDFVLLLIPYLCFSTWPGRLLVEVSPRKACLFVCSFTGLMPVGCGMKVMAEQCYYYDMIPLYRGEAC